MTQISQKRWDVLKTAVLTKESKIFIKAKLKVSKSCLLGFVDFMIFLHFKVCSYLNHKISFNLSVEVALFLVFHIPFMILFHILISVSGHESMLDNFLLTSSVSEETQKTLKNLINYIQSFWEASTIFWEASETKSDFVCRLRNQNDL